MGIDYGEEFAGALAALAPGETVRAATATTLSEGVAPPEPPQPQPDGADEVTAGSAVAAATLAVLDPIPPGSFTWPITALFWVLWGRAAAGGATSLAARLRHACPWRHGLLLVVTDQRLRIFQVLDDRTFSYRPEDPRPAPEERLRPVWDAPRDAVASARVGWYRLNWCRLVIRFVDGSWTAFGDVVDMGRQRARRIAAALNS
jgi:hypothetical protein